MRKILWSLLLTGSVIGQACDVSNPNPTITSEPELPSSRQNSSTSSQISQSPVALEFEAAFLSASVTHGVPVEILRAIAYTESGFSPSRRTHAEEVPETIGLMGLRSDISRGAHVRDAAAFARVPEASVAVSVDANIMAAAAWLRQRAGSAADSRNLLAFWDAVADYSGIEGAAAQGYAADVFALIANAQQVELLDGSMIAISVHPVPSLKARIDSARASVPASPDYSSAAYSPACSSNYTAANRTAADIQYVVIHVTQGSYSGAISWFGNCSAKVSAHYVIRSSDGAITQTLLDKHIGWHAGNWSYNQQSIGIEHEGWVDQPKWFTDVMYKESAKLTAALCDKYGIPKTRKYIIGHVEVPGATHTDPGKYWDWDKYMAYVTGTAGGEVKPPATTGVLKGFIREGDIYSGPNIAGATVKLSDGKSAATSSTGLYSFTVPPGVYTVTVSKSGYVTKSETKDVLAGVDNWKSIALVKEAPPPPPPPPDPEPEPEPEPVEEPEPEPEPVDDPENDPEPAEPVSDPEPVDPTDDPQSNDPQPEPRQDPRSENPSSDPESPAETPNEPEQPGDNVPEAGQPVPSESNGFAGGFWAPRGAGYAESPGNSTDDNGQISNLPEGDPATSAFAAAPNDNSGCNSGVHAPGGTLWWFAALAFGVFRRRALH